MNFRIYRPLCMLSLVLAQFVYPPQSNAQSLTRTPLVTTTAWQKQDDYMESRLPGKVVTEMKKVVGSLASWAQRSGVDSLGCTPAWCGAYFSNKANAFPLFRYEMRSAFFTGETSALNAEPGKGSSLVITANDLTVLQQTFSLNGNDYLSLPAMQQTYDGVQYAEWVAEKEEASAVRQTRAWVVSYAGRMPYSILCRKEYLEEAKKEISADKQRLKEDLLQRIPVKTAQQEEAEQKKEIESIGSMYSGATRDSRVRSYLASYKPDSVYFKEVFADQSASLDADSLLLDHLLTKSSPDYLDKPAFVSVPAHEFRNFEDGKPGSRMLAKWNMAYFDKNLSLARPQFLIVSWQFDPGAPTDVNLDKVISGLDYCELQGLLIATAAGPLK